MSSASASVDVRVTGRVQGVFYRASCGEEARRLGVRGWVSNEPDGSVRGHFEGSAEAVKELVAWCRSGPTYASVEDVVVTSSAATGARDFTAQ